MKRISFIFVLLVVFCISTTAFAQDQKVVPDSMTKPAPAKAEQKKDEDNGLPVVIEHFGDDQLGGTLALKLKENFRKSVLFQLSDKSKKSIRIMVRSRSEFSDRPEIGSVYSIIWTFAESENVVPFYLAEKLGIVNNMNLESSAAQLINKTDKLAAEYKYLFE